MNPDTSDYVGMDEGEAHALAASEGLRSRTVHRDGHGMLKTNDRRNDRLNFHVVDDVVTDVFLG